MSALSELINQYKSCNLSIKKLKTLADKECSINELGVLLVKFSKLPSNYLSIEQVEHLKSVNKVYDLKEADDFVQNYKDLPFYERKDFAEKSIEELKAKSKILKKEINNYNIKNSDGSFFEFDLADKVFILKKNKTDTFTNYSIFMDERKVYELVVLERSNYVIKEFNSNFSRFNLKNAMESFINFYTHFKAEVDVAKGKQLTLDSCLE